MTIGGHWMNLLLVPEKNEHCIFQNSAVKKGYETAADHDTDRT